MVKHVIKAFFYSVAGLKAAFIEEMAFRIVLLQALFIFAFTMIYPMTYSQRSMLWVCAFICIIVELLNSAIENIVDLASPDWHILAKKAKDMGSAAQFVASLSLWLQVVFLL